ncbi:cysteine desulfurase-like protein [Marinihelvus fidelis]|uniref:Cysteine desulfurase-like protein n=1 Tax=Marinihelvus fidelis TaxID=2613842 RepID=A0A5N0TEX1_9GAMM|nr:cysteine desulfurase-like protein [Marinihelvus fidelis]
MDLDAVRGQFPALGDEAHSPPLILDGPGGAQVPRQVADAIADYLLQGTANLGGAFSTSINTGRLVATARRAAADLLGAGDDEIVFGPNATSLLFSASRALSREWQAGDNVVITALDHEANISPWRLAARDRDVEVRQARVNRADGTLDIDHLFSLLDARTRMVALTAASNVTGSMVDVKRVCQHVRERSDALTCIDAVHYAPHGSVNVERLGCDLLVTSAYKYFGPHIGVLFGRREVLAGQTPYKVAPAKDVNPNRWETGTQNFEGMAGFVATIDYLAGLGHQYDAPGADRRELLETAFERIGCHELALTKRFLQLAAQRPSIRVHGITDPARAHQRTPTFALTMDRASPRELATWLGEHDVRIGDGNFYAPSLYKQLKVAADTGVLRAGFMHYHRLDEVDRFFRVLDTHPSLANGSSPR